MKIGDLARQSGLSAHAIRYYERIGLLPRAVRGASKQREYDASILVWIAFLGRLKTTGMPIREMIRYAGLRAQGPATNAERRDLLVKHRSMVRGHVAELMNCLTVLDTKIAGYGGREKMVMVDDAETKKRQPERAVRKRATGAV